MSNRIIRNLPDSKYKAAVRNVLANGSNPFGTESEITDQIQGEVIVNGLTEGISNSSADAAKHILGSAWRMPTPDEWEELTHACTMTWTTVEGVNGYLVENNGNSIFLPACGYKEDTYIYETGTDGHYWTGGPGNGGELACFGAFDSTNPTNSGYWFRNYGRSIRPVSNTEGVDLGLSVKWASANLGATNPQDYGDYFAWGELSAKDDYSWNTYLCLSSNCESELDPLTQVTKPVTSTVLHKDNTTAHLNPVKEARWDGKQDALGFTPENSANKKTSLAENSDTYYPTQKAVKTAVDAKADDSSVVHNTGAETVSGVKTFSNGLINGSLFFGSPITAISLSGNATWNIDDLKNMMKVVLSSSTNSITLPNGGKNQFRFQIIVAQDSTGSRALTISGVSGVNVYNPSEFDFSSGSANQICVCTIIWDGTEYIYECTNYVGGE